MSNNERLTVPQSDESPPELGLIMGDGPRVWSRTALEFGLDEPISPGMFSGSNLMRKLHNHEYVERRTTGKRMEETVVPKTTRATLVREVYHRGLPRNLAQLADMLGEEAAQSEIEYQEEGYATDSGYQVYLRQVASLHSNSFLIEGFEAFIEASWDFDGGLHDGLLRDAQVFGAYLIDQSPR